MHARTLEDAQGTLVWLLRRRWGLTALRGNARLLLARLEYVGSGAVAAASRRSAAAGVGRQRARALRAACSLAAPWPRGRRRC